MTMWKIWLENIELHLGDGTLFGAPYRQSLKIFLLWGFEFVGLARTVANTAWDQYLLTVNIILEKCVMFGLVKTAEDVFLSQLIYI